MPFEPTLESVKQHQVPQWYHDAKFGIFIHWGPSAVPAWAQTTGSIDEIVAKDGWPAFFRNNPYSGWYLNSLRVDGSLTQKHHVETYGSDFEYTRFGAMFDEAAQAWNPETWADLFAKVHARYAVLTTKHHDGYALWNTRHPNPRVPGYNSQRDIVGELAESVRKQGIKFGTYYSSGLDWTFNDEPIDDFSKVFSTIVQDADFVTFATQHWYELFDRYRPDIMWGDIGHSANADIAELFSTYYNLVPEGVINDRFSQVMPERDINEDGIIGPPPSLHYDFRTPEYTSFKEIQQTKWETCRGIGFAFFYNQNETEAHHATVKELVHMLTDIVSKNGNLLLDIGPMPDGTIPKLQVERLLGLGAWLDVNGEAIFDTQVWHTAEGQSDGGVEVRFTQHDGTLYATMLGTPSSRTITLHGLRAAADSKVELLGFGELTWSSTDDGLRVNLPDNLADSPAHAVKITPIPQYTV